MKKLTLRQAWRTEPETDLQPGLVRVGWTRDAMAVEAELTDLDIFNPVSEFNQVAYTLGDVFEVFLRPEGQDAYFEIHVTPQNQVLQLRFPDAAAVRKPKPGDTQDERLAPYKVWQPRITSQTRVDAPARKWFVTAAIPFAMVVESREMKTGRRWFCSFCRYDYTRGRAKPVLSSTSPHAECNFHRQQEWLPIEFNNDDG
jgi:hypothetical protein